LSPQLGGPGARWAQALLFALHVALLVSLVYLLFIYRGMRTRIPLQRWQEIAILAFVALVFAVYTRRAWRIGSDLWRALRGQESLPPDDEDEDDDRPES
jgi:hypothetical protein